jgi:hypothetical protein
MLTKLSNSRVLDNKMKRQILGGLTCKQQCQSDCNHDDQIRTALNGDSGNSASIVIPEPQ